MYSPGNLIWKPEGNICILDFGMMTEITYTECDNLMEYMVKITMEGQEGTVLSLKQLGFIPEGAPDPWEAGLTKSLRIVFTQLKKGWNVKRFWVMRKRPGKFK